MSIIDDAMNMVNESRPDIAAVLHTMPVTVGDTRVDEWAQYVHKWLGQPAHIVISHKVADTGDTEDVAANLIHEGTHVLDNVNGALDGDGDQIQTEIRAKQAEMEFLDSDYPANKFPNGKPVHDDFDRDADSWLEHYRDGSLTDEVTAVYGGSSLESMMRAIFGIDTTQEGENL